MIKLSKEKLENSKEYKSKRLVLNLTKDEYEDICFLRDEFKFKTLNKTIRACIGFIRGIK